MLPDWIPEDAWEAFVAMRKKNKKPLTDYAIKLAIKKLSDMHDEGQDIKKVLDKSTFCEWSDLYPIKDNQSNKQCKFNPSEYLSQKFNKGTDNGTFDENGKPVR